MVDPPRPTSPQHHRCPDLRFPLGTGQAADDRECELEGGAGATAGDEVAILDDRVFEVARTVRFDRGPRGGVGGHRPVREDAVGRKRCGRRTDRGDQNLLRRRHGEQLTNPRARRQTFTPWAAAREHDAVEAGDGYSSGIDIWYQPNTSATDLLGGPVEATDENFEAGSAQDIDRDHGLHLFGAVGQNDQCCRGHGLILPVDPGSKPSLCARWTYTSGPMLARILSRIAFWFVMTSVIAGSAVVVLGLYLPFIVLKAVFLAVTGRIRNTTKDGSDPSKSSTTIKKNDALQMPG